MKLLPIKPTKIIGILLLQNEEFFLKQVITNILPFCDQLFLLDHHSSDGSFAIMEHFREEHPQKIVLHRIHHPRESHQFLKPFVGTATWVFGVDGDELYDPERLFLFRERLLQGEFDDQWMLLGHVLHVAHLHGKYASGYLTPPSRSITKLYNFNAIQSWEGKVLERLHGGHPCFRSGFHEQKKRKLFEEESWEDAPLRCLHLCFIRRSSVNKTKVRKNIMENYSGGFFTWMKEKAKSLFSSASGRFHDSTWKKNHYARGGRVLKEVTSFFKQSASNQ